MESAATDPGWPPLSRSCVRILRAVVGLGPTRPDVHILGMLRSLFLGFAALVVVQGAVVAGLEIYADRPEADTGTPILVGVAVFGALTLAVGPHLRGSLDPSSPDRLARSYATRFFVRIAMAESSTTAGLVGYIVTSNPLAFVIGAAFTVVGFAFAAPTASQINDEQMSLRATGCRHELLDALLAPPP